MVGEGSERPRRRPEGHDEDEKPEVDEKPRTAQDVMNEIRGEIENKEAEPENEPKESPEDTEPPREYPEPPEPCVRDASKELAWKEDLEREREAEREKERERARQEREENAEKDALDDLEKELQKALEDRGIDPEDLKERLRDQYVKDIEDYLNEQPEDKEKDSDEEDEGGKKAGVEGSSQYDDGSGQMYEMRTKPPHESDTETEMEPQSESAEDTQEPEFSPESEPQKERIKPPSEKSEPSSEPEAVPTEPEQPSSKEDVEEPEVESVPTEKSSSRSKSAEDTAIQEDASPRTVQTGPEVPQETAKSEKESESTEPKEEDETETPEIDVETKQETEPETPEVEVEAGETKQEVESETAEVEKQATEQEEELETESQESESVEDLEDLAWKEQLLKIYNEMPEDWKEMFQEYLRGLIEDEEELERLLKKHGLEALLEDDEQMDEVRKFLELRAALREHGEEHLESIAAELGIDMEQAEQWASGEEEPQILKDVLNLEGYWAFWELLRLNAEHGLPESAEDLEAILQDNPMLELADPTLPFELWKRDARAWVEIMVMKRRGEIGIRLRNGREIYSRKDIERLSSKYGIPKAEIIAWLRGEKVPPLLRKIRSIKLKEIDEGQAEVRISYPVLLGKEMKTYEEVVGKISDIWPGFAKRSDFSKLMKHAKAHFQILDELDSRKSIHRSEITNLHKQYGIPRNTVKRWVQSGNVPMIYDMLNNAISLDIANDRILDIMIRLNGLKSWQDVKQRLESLYGNEILQSQPSYKQDAAQAKAFFRFLKSLKMGGVLPGIAKRSNVKTSQVASWYYNSILPRLVRIASRIPTERPKHGHRWLPLEMKPGQDLSNFIQVPLRVKSVKDLFEVLDQLNGISSKKMRSWAKRLGDSSKPMAFMYLLGALLSDGYFSIKKDAFSGAIGIKLGKVYDWSEPMGDAFCYYLGLLGFSAGRKKDVSATIAGRTSEMMVWSSESSPFFQWIKQALFGLSPSETKSDTPISSQWIITMPRNLQIAFLQGVADGDGYAMNKAVRVGISSKSNKEFLVAVLKSLGIESTISKGANSVFIEKGSEIEKAAKLPFFRFATSRMKKLIELVKMLNSPRSYHASSEEIELIVKLHREGYSSGEIVEILWKEMGVFRRPQTVRDIIKRHSKEN